MNKKLFAITVMMLNIVIPAYGFELSNELKSGAVYLVKFSAGVVISSIIIGIGLWIYSRIRNKQRQNSTDSHAKRFRCDIDDTVTIEEAIDTFLKINSN